MLPVHQIQLRPPSSCWSFTLPLLGTELHRAVSTAGPVGGCEVIEGVGRWLLSLEQISHPVATNNLLN